MSVIDASLRISQTLAVLTHEQILAELTRQLDENVLTGKAVADALKIAPARVSEMKKGDRRIQPREMPVLAKMLKMNDAPSTEGTLVQMSVSLPSAPELTEMFRTMLDMAGRQDLADELAPKLALLLPGVLGRRIGR